MRTPVQQNVVDHFGQGAFLFEEGDEAS